MRGWLRRLRERVLATEGPALLATIVGVALIACVLIVGSLVDTLDQAAATRERSAVQSSVAVALATSVESTFSMARWDAAVAHIYGHFDRQWALSSISGTSIAYLIDDRGRTLFAERSDGTIDPDLMSVAPQAVAALLRRLPHSPAEAARMTQGIGLTDRYRGQAAMFSAMAIIPLRGVTQVPDDHLRFLVFVEPINPQLLAEWQRNYRLPPMRLSRAPGTGQAVAIATAKGLPMTYITWAAPRPGQLALRRILPLIVAAVAMLLAAAGALMMLLRRQSASLRAASAEHQRLAEEARRALGVAEAAQRDAEHARDRAQLSRRQAEAAAAQAEQERARHAAELRDAACITAQSVRTALSASVDELGRMADRLDSSSDASVTATADQSREAAEAERRTASAVVSLEHILRTAAGLSATVSAICGESERTRDAVALASHRSAQVAGANAELLANLADVRVAIDTIAAIAAQTNMLALNAAIEAARYDSRNSGFGVVAREVKDLAHATAQSAASISRHVDDIGRAVQESVDLSAGIDGELHKILGFATNAATAAQGQDGVSSNIAQSVAAAREEARAIDNAAAGIAAAIASLARNAADTRDVSGQVRARVADLDRALQRELARLLAA